MASVHAEIEGTEIILKQIEALSSGQLMDLILSSLHERNPLSVVSVGATESFVMAQYTVLSEEEFMNDDEARIANQGAQSGFLHRGVRFPNVQLRDETVEAVRNADVIGYNRIVSWAGTFTEKVFDAYGIQPKYVYDSYLRRVVMFSQKQKFEKMLAGRKILLIGSTADETRDALNRNLQSSLGFEIVRTIKVFEYEEVPDAKRQIDDTSFDLCLLSAGTNALILASYISTVHKKVAVDIGFGMTSLYTGEVYHDYWLDNVIGYESLMKM